MGESRESALKSATWRESREIEKCGDYERERREMAVDLAGMLHEGGTVARAIRRRHTGQMGPV